MGQFSAIGQLLTIFSFLKIIEVLQIFELLFPEKNLCIDFDIKWHVLVFTHSSGRTA
jgi:hypothetical protein